MRTLVVDANNLAMRSIHAVHRPGGPMLSSHGVSTGPLLVFINMLSRAVRSQAPDRVALCWDSGVSSHRVAIYPDYKGHRNAPPEEMAEVKDTSFGLMKDFAALAGIHQVARPGTEADDLIATYVLARHPDDEVVILSSDKDFLQLLVPGVTQVRPQSGSVPDEVWDAARVRVDLGVPDPSLLAYVMALTGDASDGIPGVPRFGHKTAVKTLVLHEWDLERAIDEDPRLHDAEAEVRRNLSLVDLCVPLPDLVLPAVPPWTPTRPGTLLFQEMLGFLDRYDLASVRSRIYDDGLWASTQMHLEGV